jgi:DNA mismatch repair protein MSH4
MEKPEPLTSQVQKFSFLTSDESESEEELKQNLSIISKPKFSQMNSNTPGKLMSRLQFSEEKSSFSKKFYSTMKTSAKQNLTLKKKEFIIILNQNQTKQIGFTALSVFDSRLILGQIIDSSLFLHTKTLLHKFQPIELFLPKAQRNSILAELILKNFPNAKLNFLMPNFFEENKGFLLFTKDLERELPMRNSEIYLSLACLNCLNELLKGDSIEGQGEDLIRLENLKVEFYEQDNFLKMDIETVQDLNLLENWKFGQKGRSLIKAFYCLTIGGYNILRSELLQPLQDLEKINQRLNFVGNFMLLLNLYFYLLRQN